MALPILAKTITSALVKKGTDAKKESKKVSSEKLLPGSSDKKKTKVSKFKSRTPKTYRKKFQPTKFLPPSKIDENFDMAKLDDLLASLVDNTKDLKNTTKKDVTDEEKKNRQKKDTKEKLKRSKKEEETEEKKAVTKVKSSPMKFKTPDFFKDILGFAGRLVLATGIMEILNFLTDPENKNGLIQFLTEHMDKIVLGVLGTLALVISASFLPMVGMLGTFLSLFIPVLSALGGLLLNPMVLAFLSMGFVASKQGLGRDEEEVVEELQRQVGGSDNPLVVFSEENRNKLIERLKEQRDSIKGLDPYNVRGEIDERIKFLETGEFGYGGFSVNFGDFGYSTGGQFDFDTGQSSGGFRFGRPDTSTTSAPNVSAGQLYSIENLVQLALSVGFKGENAAIAAAIAMAESSGKTNAHNDKPPDDSYGLWQINMIGKLGPARRKKFNLKHNTDLWDPTINAQVAYKISGGSNFSAWTTYTGGKYKSFLPEAQKALQKLSTSSFTRSQQPPVIRPQTQMIPQEDLPPLPPTGVDPTYGPAQMYGAPRERGARRHAGQDFDAGPNGTFYSRIGGEVIYAANAGGGYGNVVDVYNAELGVTERIAEGDVNLVKKGDMIPQGTPVQRGTNHTGVFHYEIRKGRAGASGSFEGTMDPLKFLESLKTRVEPVRSSPSDSSQNVNYQTSYERAGTQIAMIQVPTPVPMPSGGVTGGGGFTGSSSGDVNRYEDLVVTTHYREA